MSSPPTSIATFPHRLAGHCGSGALRDLLEYHGLDFGAGPLSEGAVFGLAGGLGFLYLELAGMTPPIYLVGRTADLERDVADHLGVGLELRETDDPREGWAVVRSELDAGRPTMVWADIGELDYLRVRMHNTRHDIVVVGYDDDAGVAWVADNDREALQTCSLESLASARNSEAFPGPNRHRAFLYRWPEQLAAPRAAVRAAIRRGVDNMTGGGGEALAALEGHTGLAGVQAFARSFPGWPGRMGDELDVAMRALRIFIVKAGTGGAMFRSLHARFLRDMSRLLDDRVLLDTADVYDRLSTAWIDLAETAGRDDHAAGVPIVRTIATLEEQGVQAMQRWLERA